jgi:glyoxylase-like metal-dependent hydrolase (beta-lactamase superfamily II)
MLLQNGVISLDSTLKSHIYLIPTKKGYTLIDASFPDLGEKIIEEIKKLGIDIKKINNILLTHTD